MIRHLNIKPKITILLLMILALFMFLFEAYHYADTERALNTELEALADQKITRMTEEYVIPLWEVDSNWVEKDIDIEMMDKKLYAIVVSGEGNISEGRMRDSQWRPVPVSGPVSGDYVFREHDIEHDGEKIGLVKIYLSKVFIQQALRELVVKAVITVVLEGILILLFVAVVLNKIIIRPLHDILGFTSAIADGDYSHELVMKQTDEMGELAKGVNHMRSSIRQREEQMIELNTRFKGMAEASPLAIYLSTAGVDQKAEYINPAFIKLFGYTMEDVPSVAEWWPRAYPDEAYRKQIASEWKVEIEKAIANKTEIEPIEATVTCKDGSEKIISWGFVSTSQVDCSFGLNLTEIRKAERKLRELNRELEQRVDERTNQLNEINTQLKSEALTLKKRERELEIANRKLKELDQLKSMFIASMSHELRTPLNSIIGFTGLTLEGLSGDVNDIQRDQLQRVYNAGKHLLSLINDVIDISKIEAGRIDVFPAECSLQEIVDEAVGDIQPLAAQKQLSLNVAIPKDSILLYTDRQRLLQAILNLLGNAVKFTENGGATLTVRQIGDDIEIAVSDTGIGIAKDDLPRLFEAFERLESHLRIKAGGTGLGLYLTKKICTSLLQGKVSVQSTLGKGSVFTLQIPMRMEEIDAQA